MRLRILRPVEVADIRRGFRELPGLAALRRDQPYLVRRWLPGASVSVFSVLLLRFLFFLLFLFFLGERLDRTRLALGHEREPFPVGRPFSRARPVLAARQLEARPGREIDQPNLRDELIVLPIVSFIRYATKRPSGEILADPMDFKLMDSSIVGVCLACPAAIPGSMIPAETNIPTIRIVFFTVCPSVPNG